MPALRVGFAGTPEFAALALAAIIQAGFAVPLVLTQPDRPKGRGLKLEASPVKRLAMTHAIPVLQPATLRTEDTRAPLLAVELDVLVVAAYGLILPAAVLAWPRRGCLNIHASLLPRWRGAAPVQRAIEAGDASTGVSIMQMDQGLDTGPVVDRVNVAISREETTRSLLDKLALAGEQAIVAVLHRLDKEGVLASTPQSDLGLTYAAKISRDEAAINWALTAVELDRKIRAFDPAPGAHTALDGESLKVWAATPRVDAGTPLAAGTVIGVDSEGIDVACGTGVLRVTVVQPAGGRRMPAAAYAAGRAVHPGTRFFAPVPVAADGASRRAP